MELGRPPYGVAPHEQRGRQLNQVSVSTVGELTAAIGNSVVDKILVAVGTYELTSNMCSGSALCISRAVTIEAEVPGGVVFDAKAGRRVVDIQSGGKAELIGLSITGGRAKTSWPAENGGGVSVRAGGEATLTYTNIYENFGWKGGGLVINPGAVANMEGCNIFDNSANDYGGGLYVYAGGVMAKMEECNIYRNTVIGPGAGGGLAISGVANLKGSNIYQNEVSGSGGGIAVYGTANLDGCSIYQNEATGRNEGGGLIITRGGVANLESCTIYSNSAANAAGLAIHGSLTLLGSLLADFSGYIVHVGFS